MSQKAMEAIRHIVRRVANDASFAWHMVGTQGLYLCMAALAEESGQSLGDIVARVEGTAKSRTEVPEIVRLRKEVEQLRKGCPKEITLEQIVVERAISDTRFSAVEELLWRVECGSDGLLTVENIRKAMSGRKVLL